MIEEDPFTLPIATDPTTIRTELTSALQAAVPDFRAIGLIYHAVGAASEVISESRQNLQDRVKTEVKTLFGDLFGIQRKLGSPATSTITVSSKDTLEHELEANTIMYVGDTQVKTSATLALASGQSEGVVAIETTEPGARFNGQSGPLDFQYLDWMESVELDGPLDDGEDAQDDTEYGVALAGHAANFSVVVLQPADGVRRAMLNPAVGWAYAIADWQPTGGGAGVTVRKHVTLVVTKTDGTAVSSGVRAAIQADIDALAPANYVWHVVSPTYVPINAVATVSPDSGWSSERAVANGDEALNTAVSPGRWLAPDFKLAPNYVPIRRVHKSILIASVKNAVGVGVVDSLVINGDADLDEVLLDSPIKLPQAGTITVSAA